MIIVFDRVENIGDKKQENADNLHFPNMFLKSFFIRVVITLEGTGPIAQSVVLWT